MHYFIMTENKTLNLGVAGNYNLKGEAIYKTSSDDIFTDSVFDKKIGIRRKTGEKIPALGVHAIDLDSVKQKQLLGKKS